MGVLDQVHEDPQRLRQIEPADQQRAAILEVDPHLPAPDRTGHSLEQRADQIVDRVDLDGRREALRP